MNSGQSRRSRFLAEAPDAVAIEHEKAPGFHRGPISKLERAKRLEGSRERPDTVSSEDLHFGVSTPDTQLSTPAAPTVSDLAEIVTAWPKLSNEVRAAVMTLVRLSRRDAFATETSNRPVLNVRLCGAHGQ